MIKLSLYLSLIVTTAIGFATGTLTPAAPQTQEKVIAWAKENLPQKGTLQRDEDFVYLKVDDRYIHQLYPLLISPEGFKKEQFNVGAHITVFYARENGANKIKEYGQTFTFQPVSVARVELGRKNYYILVVDSPELTELRKRYGFSATPVGDKFHITIASKLDK